MEHGFTLYHGDCLDVLRTLPDNSVDSIVTDPPYGLTQGKKGGSGTASVNLNSPYGRARIGTGNGAGGFMGHKWDADVPSEDIWRECLRVLRPGAHLLAFAGTRTQHRMAVRIEDAGFEIRDMIAWVYGSGFPKSHNGPWGGTALKPALEPITVARKPLSGTVAANVQQWGTGGLNIEGCKVHTDDAQGRTYTTQRLAPGAQIDATGNWHTGQEFMGATTPGRWPANLIHDGSEDVVALFPAKAGAASPVKGTEPSSKTKHAYGEYGKVPGAFHADEGSAARFFYCAKASRADRNEGVGGSDTPAVREGATMRDREDADWQARNGNHHPTVKPTDLMRYLCRLVTPPGGVVLDPFMGSGSTGKAAMLEGFGFVGIDLSEEYVQIARQRVAHAQAQYRREQPVLLGAD